MNESNRRDCQSAWARNQASHLLRLKILSDIWRADWPTPVAIKGTDYIENLYIDPGARWCADMDLLVSPSTLSNQANDFPPITQTESDLFTPSMRENTFSCLSTTCYDHANPARRICGQWHELIANSQTASPLAILLPVDRCIG